MFFLGNHIIKNPQACSARGASRSRGVPQAAWSAGRPRPRLAESRRAKTGGSAGVLARAGELEQFVDGGSVDGHRSGGSPDLSIVSVCDFFCTYFCKLPLGNPWILVLGILEHS